MTISPLSFISLVNSSIETENRLFSKVLATNNITYAPSRLNSTASASTRIIDHTTAMAETNQLSKYLATSKTAFETLSEKVGALSDIVGEMTKVASSAYGANITTVNKLFGDMVLLQFAYSGLINTATIENYTNKTNPILRTSINPLKGGSYGAGTSVVQFVNNQGNTLLYPVQSATLNALNIPVGGFNLLEQVPTAIANLTDAQARLNTIKSSLSTFAETIGYFKDISELKISTEQSLVDNISTPNINTLTAQISANNVKLELGQSLITGLIQQEAMLYQTYASIIDGVVDT